MAVIVPFLIQAAASVATSYIVGRLFGPKPQNTEGPKLEDRRMQTSTYGSSIPLVFGTYRSAGTVIWGTDFIEEAVTSSGGGGGKGSPSTGTTTEYNYYANFAVQLCEGQITGIRRIWADGRLIFDPVFSALSLPFARVYDGGEAQLPDPFIESIEGVGKTPAYRGTAYVVFERWAVKDYGNRIPNLSFEIERSLAPTAGSQGSPSNPLAGSMALAESTAPPWPVAIVPAATGKGAALYTGGNAGLAIVASETANANGQYGFTCCAHTAGALMAAGTWSPGGTFQYANRGGVNLPATIYPGQARYRRVIFEQAVAGAQAINTCFVGSAATLATRKSAESFSLAAAFVGPAQLTNFSLANATPVDRIRAITAPLASGALATHLLAMSHAANKGGVICSSTGTYCYDFRPNWAAGERLHDVVHSGAEWFTAEANAAGQFSFKKFNASWNLQSSSPMPSGHTSWRINVRSPLLYAVGLPAGRLYLSLSGRWCDLGLLQSADVSDVDNGQGRNYAWEIFRPNAANWLLSRYQLTPPGSFTSLSGLGGGYPLANIIAELVARTGAPMAFNDVSQITNQVRGYMIPRPMTARAAIETIIQPHFVEGVESDGRIKWYPLSQPILLTIPEEDLDVRESGQSAKSLMQLTRMQEVELPKRVSIIHASFNGPAYDYQEVEVHAQRLATAAVSEERQDMPISFKTAETQPIADAHLRRAWLGRTKVQFTTLLGSRHHAYTLLEPGDLVTARGLTLRLLEKQEAKGIIQWQAVIDDASIYPFITATTGIEISLTDPTDEGNEPTDNAATDLSSDGGSDYGGGDNNPDDTPADGPTTDNVDGIQDNTQDGDIDQGGPGDNQGDLGGDLAGDQTGDLGTDIGTDLGTDLGTDQGGDSVGDGIGGGDL